MSKYSGIVIVDKFDYVLLSSEQTPVQLMCSQMLHLYRSKTENLIRKPYSFLMFSGGIEYNVKNKWVKVLIKKTRIMPGNVFLLFYYRF